MTRDELKVGYLVELKNGDRYLVMSYNFVEKDCVTERFILLNENGKGFCRFTYDKNLHDTDPLCNYYIQHDAYDIEKIWGLPNKLFAMDSLFDISNRTLIWQREVKEMTLEEVCDALGYEVKIVK